MGNKSEFTSKCKAINNVIDASCDVYVFATKSEGQTSFQVKGTPADCMYLLHELVDSLRNKMYEDMPHELVEQLLKSILKTDDEIHDEVNARIPAWLKKMMDLDDEEEDEDDTTDEADDDEEEDEAEDDSDGTNPDLSVRVDLHVHSGDDDC